MLRLKKINFAIIVFIVGSIVAVCYLCTYLFPMTDNAFVLQDITPVSSEDSGIITQIFVTNGQQLKKGDPILQIDPKSYQLRYNMAEAQYKQGLQGLVTLQRRMQSTGYAISAATDSLKLLRYQYHQKNHPSVKKAVPHMEVKSLSYEVTAQKNRVASLKKQLSLEHSEYKQAVEGIGSLKATKDLAKLRLDRTLVRTQANGFIQDLALGVGTVVRSGEPLFSFINTDVTYIQANMIETDLTHVKQGDQVVIFPRTYLWHKIYHGVVVSNNWFVNRQIRNPIEGAQVLMNQNKWLLLPQRMPVQIKITEPDKKYPLKPGMSTYVYIKTSH
jgi:multidrug resistance efflux pump